MDSTRLPHAPHPLAPDSQTAGYSRWLKIGVLLQTALTISWSPGPRGIDATRTPAPTLYPR